jgi:toxin ParE1/3/4
MAAYTVLLVREAERDLADLYAHVDAHDTPGKADDLLDALEARVAALTKSPSRGQLVPELERLSIRLYRQVHYKPYRILYTIQDHTVIVMAILDGRRDVLDLLHRRLLRS